MCATLDLPSFIPPPIGRVRSGPSCKLVWREPVKARVWPPGIAVDAPRRDHLSGMSVAGEQMLVQAFIPELAVEAFHEAVLYRLARCEAAGKCRSKPAGHQPASHLGTCWEEAVQ